MSAEEETQKCLRLAVERFRARFGAPPDAAVFAPGRVNLIGEHTDYNDGFVFPMALPLVTVMVGRLSTSDKCTVLTCANVPSPEQTFGVPSHPGPGRERVTTQVAKWSRYVLGVAALMNGDGKIRPFDAVIASSVPLGSGLSSSAALEVATCLLLGELCGVKVGGDCTKALLCQEAEHRYVWTNCGIMDQFISVMATQGNALLIDCRSHDTKAVPLEDDSLVVLVTNSKVEHMLSTGAVDKESEYNERRTSCESAASILGAGKLRDVTMTVLEASQAKLGDDVIYRRARHVIGEISRTEAAVVALQQRDYAHFGKLMNESHQSLSVDYEVSCVELDELVSLACGQDKVYGSRMTGGGFGGCTVTLLHRDALQSTMAIITEQYFSVRGKEPEFYVAIPGKGAGVISTML